jgi:hypothetical protein
MLRGVFMLLQPDRAIALTVPKTKTLKYRIIFNSPELHPQLQQRRDVRQAGIGIAV